MQQAQRSRLIKEEDQEDELAETMPAEVERTRLERRETAMTTRHFEGVRIQTPARGRSENES